MLTIEQSLKPLGFTAQKTCDNCNNKRNFHVLQYSRKNIAYGFIPAGTVNGEVIFKCPVCEKSEKVYGNSIFSSKNNQYMLKNEMMANKEMTKVWVGKLSFKDKEDLFKRYNKLGLSELVVYLNNHSS